MLQGVGELREGVWETRGFTFRVLLIPHGPFTEVATASEVMLPYVPLLKALEFRSLNLGCLGSTSVLELFELLFRKCQIFLQNLGQGFLSLNISFHPRFLGGQIIAKHAHGVIVNLFHLRIIHGCSMLSSRSGNLNLLCNFVRSNCVKCSLLLKSSSLILTHSRRMHPTWFP